MVFDFTLDQYGNNKQEHSLSSNIPQFHLALERKNASSRLIHDGWYALGQPLKIENKNKNSMSGDIDTSK